MVRKTLKNVIFKIIENVILSIMCDQIKVWLKSSSLTGRVLLDKVSVTSSVDHRHIQTGVRITTETFASSVIKVNTRLCYLPGVISGVISVVLSGSNLSGVIS